MASRNPVVTIVGTLGQNPVSMGSGVRLRVAQNNRVKNSSGEWEDGPTSWYTVKAWRNVADQALSTLQKGMEVIIIGELKEETWTDNKTNEKRSAHEITADHIGVTIYTLSKTQPRNTVSNSRDDAWDTATWSTEDTVKVPF